MSTNIMPTGLIEVSFTGEGISPNTVKASDVAEILNAIETMVESQVLRDHPTIGKETVVVGLVGIKSSSLDLQFSSTIPELAVAAFQDTGQAIRDRDYSRLPSSSSGALDIVVSFTRKKRCIADLIVHNGKRDVIATITPDTVIERKPLLTGETTIYGQVVRVGGRKPRVMVETVGGGTIYCDAGTDIARSLGGKLYQVVGLAGIAEWDSKTLVMDTFDIKAILPYEATPLKRAMSELAEIARPYYDDITDVSGYVAALRGGSEEEPE